MVSGTSRRFAVPMVFACLGVLGAAEAAHAAGGLSVTPAILERRARTGQRRLAHAQQHDQRDAAGDGQRAAVAAGAQRQGDRPTRARPSTATCARRAARSRSAPARRCPSTSGWCGAPESGSLYGNVDILGKPTRTKGRKGIIPQYRLISSLRLHPRKKTHQAAHGRGPGPQPHVRPAGPQPRQHDRSRSAGTYRLSGPGSRSGSFKSVSVVPGKLVAIGLTSTSRLQEGPLHPHRVALAGRQALQRAHERHALR